ncbi:MAG: hypothetical protein IKF82_01210 [Bacilli bacterium]|nr:hypothetical protein [Bacilli bacterium]
MTTKIKILSETEYQTFPKVEGMIEVEDSILNEIGKTKYFDVENNKVIDYDNTKELRIEEINARIRELKELLAETDYRAIKYSEGLYTQEEYAPYKYQRQSYRDEINQLEEELSTL